ncbi:acyltransferase family protein [Woodsholea maritima]|uniref:acyltransferase family protein n=1 Tax=Woodsholea maritima TaxID=240237 RepID=UPI0003807901|nr:acyltransferase [Woodsholea maritima]
MAMSFWFTPVRGTLFDRSNNFTAIRIGLASWVVLAHAVLLVMGYPYRGTIPVAIDTIVQWALDGFFILSGYMLCASLMRSTDMKRYAGARILRIFPGLIAAIILMWLVIAPVFHPQGLLGLMSEDGFWTFPAVILGQIDPLAALPGVFQDSTVPAANGSLWTIRYELLCYLIAGIAASLGLFRAKWGVGVMALGAVALSLLNSHEGYQGPGAGTIFAATRFGGAFMVGAAFYAFKDHIRLSPLWALIALCIAFILAPTQAGMITSQIAIAFVLLIAGYVRLPGTFGHQLREVEDVSYGLYILHFPLGHVLLSLQPDLSWPVLFAQMWASALITGWILRVTIEKPAMGLMAWVTPKRARQGETLQPNAPTRAPVYSAQP